MDKMIKSVSLLLFSHYRYVVIIVFFSHYYRVFVIRKYR